MRLPREGRLNRCAWIDGGLSSVLGKECLYEPRAVQFGKERRRFDRYPGEYWVFHILK